MSETQWEPGPLDKDESEDSLPDRHLIWSEVWGFRNKEKHIHVDMVCVHHSQTPSLTENKSQYN